MIRVLLGRHGETEWNVARRLQGQQDIGLSEVGRRQVEALRGTVADAAPEHVLVSGLCRARESAEVLGLTVRRADRRFDEAHLGDWEGRLSAGIRAENSQQYADWRAGLYRPPGAESFETLTARVLDGLSAAVQDAEDAGARTLLVVTHGGPIRALLREVVGLDPRSAVPSHPASLTVLDVEGSPAALRARHEGRMNEVGAARLRLYNYSPALSRQDPSD